MVKVDKIIFLDIDGVLNEFYPNNTLNMIENAHYWEQRKENKNFVYNFMLKYEKAIKENIGKQTYFTFVEDIDFERVEVLNKIIKESCAKIVISSSWRGMGIDNITLLLCLRGFLYPKSIISATPRLTGIKRGLEIQSWLDSNEEVLEYVIIDDEMFDIKETHPKENIFQVRGLTEKDAGKIIKFLNKNNR